MKSVPCNGCTLCCRTGVIVLHPALGDDPFKYETEKTEIGLILKRKEDGSCIYVTDKGCSIWPNSPAVCRAFDCREYARSQWALRADADRATITRGWQLPND